MDGADDDLDTNGDDDDDGDEDDNVDDEDNEDDELSDSEASDSLDWLCPHDHATHQMR